MRCRLDDLVRIADSSHPENIDRIGTVVDGPRCFADKPSWLVDFPRPVTATRFLLGVPLDTVQTPRTWCFDESLRPIRDPGKGAVDEMVLLTRTHPERALASGVAAQEWQGGA